MDLYNDEGELIEETEPIEGEERDSEPREEEMEEGTVEDEEVETPEDIESPRASLPPKEKKSNKKRKRTSSDDSSVEDASPKDDKKKVKGPLSNTNKSINVGKEFQAVIEENADLTNFKDYTPDREQAYWEHHGDVDTDELEKFVNEHSAKYLVPIDSVLFILMEKKMDFREAAIEIAKRNILQDGWKDDERYVFENSFTHVGKNFHQMHAAVAHRSLRSIIHYYYDSKKSITYRAFASKNGTEVENEEEYEPSVQKQPQEVFANMCENCGEQAERMMFNEQMNRIECNACLIYFKNMFVPRPTPIRLVVGERLDLQVPCPDTMRDMMKWYNYLSAPATGKTFEMRKVKDLFSTDQILRTTRASTRDYRRAELRNLPVNRAFYLGGAPLGGPSTSEGPSDFDRAFDTLNGVVEKLEREINALPLLVDIQEYPEQEEEEGELEQMEQMMMANGEGLLMMQEPCQEVVVEPEVNLQNSPEKTEKSKVEVEEAPDAPEEPTKKVEPEDLEAPEAEPVEPVEPEVKQEEPQESIESAPESVKNSEDPENPPEESKEEEPAPESSEASEASKSSKSSTSSEVGAPEAPKAPEATEPTQNPEGKSPEPTESSESPENGAAPEGLPEEPKRKSPLKRKMKLSGSCKNLRSLSGTSSKISKKSKKAAAAATTESSQMNVPSSSSNDSKPTTSSRRPPGGPAMYIWQNKRKTQCQEEMEVLLDDSRRKLFEAGQHSSQIDYKKVANWKNDMAALRERMSHPKIDMDLYPQIVLSGDRTRFGGKEWTEQDRVDVQRLFKWYGPNFRQIADVMCSKTADQVFNFYKEHQAIIEEGHEEFTKQADKAVQMADERKINKLGL